MSKTNLPYAGVDGCKAGWWAWLTDGQSWEGHLYPTLQEFWRLHTDQLVTALVDIPIGLLDHQSGPRTCDQWARKQLGSQRSSIFIPPVRPTIAAMDPRDKSGEAYRTACAINAQATGKKISKQAFFISFKIREADQLLQSSLPAQSTFAEAHPELAFRWLKGSPLLHGKKTEDGQYERLNLLAEHIPNAKMRLGEVRARYTKTQVTTDDMLDAWVLALLASEQIAPLSDHPTPAPFDSTGLPMRMRMPNF